MQSGAALTVSLIAHSYFLPVVASMPFMAARTATAAGPSTPSTRFGAESSAADDIAVAGGG